MLTNVQPLTSADLDLGHIDAAQPVPPATRSSQIDPAQAAAAAGATEPQDLNQEGSTPADDAHPKVLHWRMVLAVWCTVLPKLSIVICT